ncbi:ATP-binding protein [Variovorax dokdonensis]|uniref:ATP-binding protein n=1 Tax=Variovorax dokdonensis TaxID=344883 RepID=A0ABT7N823_9BURK|nr:ATP-binding protein [Variovorax dokdonensis]MDM0044072.1 ATP-binding protein [Variovorax dokdonensis]
MKGESPLVAPWQRQRSCPATLGELPPLLDMVREACAHMDAPQDMAHDLLLMAEEACVNIMRHAYPEGADGTLLLRVRCTHRGVELVLQDRGIPFDPLAAEPPDPLLDAMDREIGGLGVHLIRQLADRVDYRRDPALGNVLVIEKHLPPVS